MDSENFFESILAAAQGKYPDAYNQKLKAMIESGDAVEVLLHSEALSLAAEVVYGVLPFLECDLLAVLQKHPSLFMTRLNIETIGNGTVGDMVRLALWTEIKGGMEDAARKMQETQFGGLHPVDAKYVLSLSKIALGGLKNHKEETPSGSFAVRMTPVKNLAEVVAFGFAVRDFEAEASFENFETLIDDLTEVMPLIKATDTARAYRRLEEVLDFVTRNKRTVFDQSNR